ARDLPGELGASQRSLHFEGDSGAFHSDPGERRALDAEIGEDGGAGPLALWVLREVDDQAKLAAGNLDGAFPARGGGVCRARQGGQKEWDNNTHQSHFRLVCQAWPRSVLNVLARVTLEFVFRRIIWIVL